MLIYLTCFPAEQLRRIRARNRPHEAAVDLDYIHALQAEIDVLLEASRKSGVKLITVDTHSVYLPDNLAFAETLALDIAKSLGVDKGRIIDPEFPRQYVLAG